MAETIELATLVLTGLLGMMVGGNDLSACSGTIIGSGTVTRRTGIMIALVGYTLGLSMEGPKLFKVREAFLPDETSLQILTVLLATFLILTAGQLAKVPVSLSKTMTGTIVGVSVAVGAWHFTSYVAMILAFWFLAPLVATSLGVLFIALDDRYSPRKLWLKLSILKLGLLAAAFASAYVTGSNTLGLIAGTSNNLTPAAVIIAGLGGVAGALTLGRGALRRLTEGIFSLRYPNAFFSQSLGAGTVELAVQFGVPLSTTETVSSGIIGSGLARKMRVMNLRNLSLIVMSWVVSPAAGFLAGFLLTRTLA